VIVSHDGQTGTPIVQFAHTCCAPSGFTNMRLAPDDDELESACRTAVRPHPTAPAVLFFEVWQRAMTDTGEDLELALYRQLGLSPTTAGLTDPNPPHARSLQLAPDGTEARIELTRQGAHLINSLLPANTASASPGAALHNFQLTDNSALRLWRDTLARTGRCLLITGRALGLDHPSIERIDVLLQEAEALAALVTATVKHDQSVA
jgi:hypothetical protein